ncbi:head-tail connector protein [Crenobacter cavernae]|uniref:Phage gp6-like head-tail connector protein n=1 Tax=Crenobacter cavernae TaxID=2290923 RepID=A0ABY0FAL8_9NEIS|nr:phage head-tail connector protein [Crenobacter cavernae]RXZ42706.1 hypothetical protein EBB06_12495 [Crenobacter cavernae]
MAAVVISRTAAAVLSLDDIKQQCRIEPDDTFEDALLQQMERAAVRACEGKLGGPLLNATYREALSGFPAVDWLHPAITRPHTISAITLKQDGQTVPWTDYQTVLEDNESRLKIAPRERWPKVDRALDAVVIDFTAGFGDSATAVPEDIKQWLLYRVGTLYGFREAFIAGAAVNDLPGHFVDGLLTPYLPDGVVI